MKRRTTAKDGDDESCLKDRTIEDFFGRPKHEMSSASAVDSTTSRTHPVASKTLSPPTSEAVPSRGAEGAHESASTAKVSDSSLPSSQDVAFPTDSVQQIQPLRLIERKGDLFCAPPNTVLVQACNCQGSWGAGIAAAFRKRYPRAYRVYQQHCKAASSAADLLGTAQLIPPLDGDTEKHFVGCLYTSRSMGLKKDSVSAILDNTGPAMQDLLEQIKAWNAVHGSERKAERIWMCQINSGLFNVPWEKTKSRLEQLDGLDNSSLGEVIVVSPP